MLIWVRKLIRTKKYFHDNGGKLTDRKTEELPRKAAGYAAIIPVLQMRKLRPRDSGARNAHSSAFVPNCHEKPNEDGDE